MRQKLLEFDISQSRRISIAEKPGIARSMAALLAHSGDSWFWLLGLGGVWWLGAEAWKSRAASMIVGILLTAALVMLIKIGIRRSRPVGEWGSIYRSTDPHSFPSGHAARAVMLAVLALSHGPPWFGALLAVWAPLVSLARAAMGVHYLSDVLAGMTFGLIVGLVIILLF